MSPPKELPGFYFDPEKNRYFPIRGPIPGSKRPSSGSTPSTSPRLDSDQIHQLHATGGRKKTKSSELLQYRELHGGFCTSRKFRCNFKKEYQKLQASHPTMWEYHSTASAADNALEQLHGIMQTPRGLMETTLLAAGSVKGSVSLYEVGGVGQFCDYGLKCMRKLVWPHIPAHRTGLSTAPESIWTAASAFISFPSNISCIKRMGKHSPDLADDGPSFQHALYPNSVVMPVVTTLGSGFSGGSVHVLNLCEPLDFHTSALSLRERTTEIASLDCTTWTADCNSHGTHAALGTNLGAALINLETGGLSWVHRSKSAIFSQQFDQSGNIVICGFRNGAIVPVDIRQKHSGHMELSAASHSRQGPQLMARAPIVRHHGRSRKQMFEPKKNMHTLFMSSAVCSLVTLQTDDQYFLASSMDGNIKLFDLRLMHRGAVQSYEGHVNSHTRLQLGVDPAETLVMSGGEDRYLRVWSIKTGELLFGENVSNSVLVTVCLPRSGGTSYGNQGSLKQPRCSEQRSHEPTYSWGAWLGSHAGLYYIHDS